MIIDIHTHGDRPRAEGILRITNIRAGIDNIVCTYPFSYGVHPYDVEKVDIGYALSGIVDLDPLAIGEIGMDFRFQDTAAKQSLYFKTQAEKAAELGKPVIIHAVKSLPQILSVMERYCVPFVIHGFRGSMEQVEEIVRHGGFVSVSPKIPSGMDRIFDRFGDSILLETDETGCDIKDHYRQIAEICKISLMELETVTENNFRRWSGNKGPCFF